MKSLKFAFIIFMGCVFLLAACKESDSINEPEIPEGAYVYSGYDSTHVKIVTGWLQIQFKDSITVTGEWELDKIGDPKNIGPQVGKGNLVGNLQGEKIYLNLNPDYVDNNVFLTGDYSEDKIEGEWVWSGFPGILNRGSFKAVK